MSITLKADNRSLLINSVASSYLNTNYLSNVTSLVLKNSSGFIVELGDSTTQFTITMNGTTATYTYTETGTSPGTLSNLMRTDGSIVIAAQNFSVVNNGTFTLVTVGSNYFTVINAAGTGETGTIGTGSIKLYIYALLGEFSLEQTEVVQVTNVVASTNTITVGATKFAHSESTKVTIIPYNQVRFYHTATATYSTADPINDFTNINADSYFSTVKDTSNSTGFGFFVFSNSSTGKVTTNSNAIPYANFGSGQIKTILDTFYSALNNTEQKLINNTDSFSYLNEAISIIRSEFNMVNNEYYVESIDTITTEASTQEYSLESNFSKVRSVYNDSSNKSVDFIPLSEVSNYDDNGNVTKYYIRNDSGTAKIGFSPIPTGIVVYDVRYKSKATTLTSYADSVDLPDGGEYMVVNYMLFKAGMKLSNSNAIDYKKLFEESISRLKVTSHKRDSALDAWGISPESNI